MVLRYPEWTLLYPGHYILRTWSFWVSSVVVSLARMERKLAVTGSPYLLACLLRVRACYFCVGRQLFTAVDLEWQILDRGRRSLPNPGGCSNTPTTPRLD